MSRRIALAFILTVLVLVGYLAFSRYNENYVIERDDSVAVSKVVTATFARRSSLNVGTLSGTVQSTAADRRAYGMLNSDQVIKAPYTIDYSVDVSRLSLDDYIWNAQDRSLSVRMPEVIVGKANVDESQASVVRRRGVFITRDAMDVLSRGTSRRAQMFAEAKAREPEQLAKARDNARAALTTLLSGPLAASGMEDVRIVVRFPTDGQAANERWDESRSLATVLAENSK